MGSHPAWSDADPSLPVSPWWHCDGPAQGISFRVARSLEPLSEEMQMRVWNPDCPELLEAVKTCYKEGRGAIGRVDESLPDVIRRYRTLMSRE